MTDPARVVSVPVPGAPGRRHVATFLVLAGGATLVSLLQSLLNPVLSTIQSELGTDQATVTWVVTAYLLSAAIVTPTLGRIGDIFGRRRAFLAAIAAVGTGAVLAALAPSIGILIAARVLQGAGVAVFPLAFGLARDHFPAERVATAIGGISALLAVGGGVGVILAGPITSALGWRWLFWIPAAFTVIVLVAGARLLPRAPSVGGRLSVSGAVLLAGWLVTLLLPLSKGSTWGWGSSRVLILLAAAVVTFIAWVLVELRSTAPLIDMRVMALRGIWSANVVTFLFGAAMFATFAFVPRFAQVPGSTGYGLGASVSVSGLVLLPMLVTMAVTGALSGSMAAALGARRLLAVGAGLGALGTLSLALLHATLWQVATGAGLFGLGLGIVFTATTNVVVAEAPPDHVGAASGMNVNIRTIGGAVGTAVFSTILAGGIDAQGLPTESAYTTAFLVIAIAAAAALAAVWAVPRRTVVGARAAVVG